MTRRMLAKALLGILLGSLLGGAARAQSSGARPATAPVEAVRPASPNPPNLPGRAAAPSLSEFRMGPGDVLTINVWKEAELSRTVPVRSDGCISLPLIGEVRAGGQTPRQLEDALREKLKDYVSEPEVTVMVQEMHSQKFNVLGMVVRPGSFALANPTTVVDAIAQAGGFRDFAKQKHVYVLRRNPEGTSTRVEVNYKEVIQGRNAAQNVTLEANDTVVVP